MKRNPSHALLSRSKYFSTPARPWKISPPSMAPSEIDAVLIHAVYLLNCASEDPEIRAKSVASLTHSLRIGEQIGACAVVLHPGSAKTGDVASAIGRAGEAILEALAESEACPVHLANTAGTGG